MIGLRLSLELLALGEREPLIATGRFPLNEPDNDPWDSPMPVSVTANERATFLADTLEIVTEPVSAQ
ncbi:MAG TPA: hypothetical protein VMJ10_18785 [Kofleriaceae bacterium]|nr:hypothetical protein [Kofleriaceae bacterium]